MKRSLVPVSCVAMFACLAVAFSGSLGAGRATLAGPDIGGTAPAFSLTDQEGRKISLADYAGKVVVLEWFCDSCPFVIKQYKNGDMNKLASSYAGKDVVWLAINSTGGKTDADNKKISSEWNINRPVLNDSAGTVGKAYGAATTPHMFIVNKDGTLAYHGAIDSIRSNDPADNAKATNYVKKALDEILANKPVTTAETKSYGCGVKYKD